MTHSDFASCVREACAMFFILDFYIYGLLKACIYEMQIRYPSLSCVHIASSTVCAYILTLQAPFISKSESCLLRAKVKQISLTKTLCLNSCDQHCSTSCFIFTFCGRTLFPNVYSGELFYCVHHCQTDSLWKKKSITM